MIGHRTIQQWRLGHERSSRWRALAISICLLLLPSQRGRPATFEVQVGSEPPSFIPSALSIHTGDTVQWSWAPSAFAHTVTSGTKGKADGRFDSGTHAAPFSFSFTFSTPGVFDYFCQPHYSMGMVGKITVTESSGSASAAQLLNISTRMRVQTGENVMIGGFIVSGSAAKKVLVRAIGPSLAQSGIADVLADPFLELHGAGGSLIASNNNWKDTQQAEIQATTIPPSNDLESAIVATLPANNSGYTAVVKGADSGTGVGLVEVYDLDQPADSKLANISTRGFVLTGSNVMIGGFILGNGNGAAKVIARGIGPSLAQAGVAGALADPTLELRDGNGALVRSNDNWRESQETEIQASGVAPTNDLESAIVASVAPGSYTAILAGKNGGTGVALVEVFNLQ